MMYANFEYYKDDYQGTEIEDAQTFVPLANQASREMNRATAFMLAESAWKDHERVKQCQCAVCDLLHEKSTQSTQKGQLLSAVKVGEWSKTYDNKNIRTEEEIAQDIYQLIKDYLSSLGLLDQAVKYQSRCLPC